MAKGHGFIWMPRDWRTGTRKLSLEARGLYADIISMLHEEGGRLKYDEDDLCADCGLKSVRVLRRVLGELVAHEKVRIEDGYILNRRVTDDLADRARRKARDEGGAPPQDNPQAVRKAGGKEPPAGGSAAGLGEVSPMFGEYLGETSAKLEAPSIVFIEESPSRRAAPPIPIPVKSVETSSPEPRARGRGGGGGRPLGEGRGLPPPAAPGMRWARRDIAEGRLIVALLGLGVGEVEVIELVERASDPTHPQHHESARQCEVVSRRRRCGWYRPVVH